MEKERAQFHAAKLPRFIGMCPATITPSPFRTPSRPPGPLGRRLPLLALAPPRRLRRLHPHALSIKRHHQRMHLSGPSSPQLGLIILAPNLLDPFPERPA